MGEDTNTDNEILEEVQVSEADKILDSWRAMDKKQRSPKIVFDAIDKFTGLDWKAWAAFKSEVKYLFAGISAKDMEAARRGEGPREPDDNTNGQIIDTSDGISIDQDKDKLPEIMEQAEKAIVEMPGAPHVFQRAGSLVRILPPEPTPESCMNSASSAPSIKQLTMPSMRLIMAKSATWFEPKGKDKLARSMPLPWVVETMLDKGDWSNIPPLTGIVHSPTIRQDGTLLYLPGYDASTGLYLHSNGMGFPHINLAPTHQDAIAACQELSEPFVDFPFGKSCHRSAVIAAILSILVRHCVKSVPLFAIRATTRGSGKTLLADCISLIGIGRCAPKFPQLHKDDEESKRLLAVALNGDPVVVIDNVVGSVGSPSLDLAITSQLFTDRLLGKNETKEAPMRAVFFTTGNNYGFKGDLARRSVPIDLVPDMENPEKREDFEHSKLPEWIAQERPRLVSAALTMLMGYHVAKCPKQNISNYGSFELWSDLIRSCVVWCGEADPCLGREDLEAISDDTFESHAELLEAWHALYKDKNTTLPSVVSDIQLRGTPTGGFHDKNGLVDYETATEKSALARPYDRVKDALGAIDEKYDGSRINTKRVGHSMGRLIGRVINGKRLIKGARSGDGLQWRVETVQCTSKSPRIDSKIDDFDVPF